MTRKFYKYITVAALALQYSLNGNCSQHHLLVGPQWEHLTRTREGGIKQKGDLFGGFFLYERVKRYGWYLGAEGSYAKGTIKGSIDDTFELKSRFTDQWIEGRFGYTFQQKCGRRFAFTPYIGIGYAQEQNNFGSSSPLPLHFKTHFWYPFAGFRSQINVCEHFVAGVNFRVRIPYDPKCKVSNDPENENVSQNVGDKLQYRVEVPLTYYLPCYERLGVSVMPFYEYRPYGEHANYPFDYYKTTIKIWGVGAGAAFRF
jgi:hypothetical protein